MDNLNIATEDNEMPLPHAKMYKQYIKFKHRDFYFKYDLLFDSLCRVHPDDDEMGILYDKFDSNFVFAIKQVDLFLLRLIEGTETELVSLLKFWNDMSDEDKVKTSNDKTFGSHRTLNRLIKQLFLKCEDSIAFYKFNDFSMRKLAFYFEAHKNNHDEITDTKWSWKTDDKLRSSKYYKKNYLSKCNKLIEIKKSCEDFYSKVFRQKYQFLVSNELAYQESEGSSSETLMYLGFKVGIVIAICLILVLINCQPQDFDLFKDPAVYIFSAVGSLILFRLLWGVNVFLWYYYDINYITLFDFENLHPNYNVTISNSLNLLVLFFVIVLIYNFSLSASFSYNSHFLYAIMPVMLMVLYFGYRNIQDYFLHTDTASKSTDLFSVGRILNIFSTPFVRVTFVANYAGDCLTSFTGILVDSSYAACFFISGQFLKNPIKENANVGLKHFGSPWCNCGDTKMLTFTSLVQLIPLTARFLQCCRAGRDMKALYPQAWNALKYASTIFVVLVNYTHASSSITYLTVIIVSLFKWWWDVTMDWGLGIVHYQTWIDMWTKYGTDKNDLNNYLLRKNRLYPHTYLYYVAIVLNLILRFLWVSSLLQGQGIIITKQVSIFLSALEIFRRCMWGHFRVEWEHVKVATKGTPGFILFTAKPSNVAELLKNTDLDLAQEDFDDDGGDISRYTLIPQSKTKY